MSQQHDYLFNLLNSMKVSYDPQNLPDYIQGRLTQEKLGNKLLPGVRTEELSMNGIHGERVFTESSMDRKIVYYVHGGGFTTGSASSRHIITGAIALRMGTDVYSVDYRLAPENPCPTQLEDVFTGYLWLVDKFGADRIVAAGESAGGNLILCLAVKAKQMGVALPSAIVVLSPMIRFDPVYPSYTDNLSTDCILSNIHQECIDVYLQGEAEKLISNPMVSPCFADMTGFPPTFVSASTTEILRDDALALYIKLCDAGVKTELSLREGMMHAYILFQDLPEAQDELEKVKSFLVKNKII